MLPSWSSLIFWRALFILIFANSFLCRGDVLPAVTYETQAVFDGKWAGVVVWHFQNMIMLPSWSSLMFSRVLLIQMFASACLCRGYVVAAFTCEQKSSGWWLVRGCCCLLFLDHSHATIVVILDIFACSAHTDNRECICMKADCRICLTMRTSKQCVMAGEQVLWCDSLNTWSCCHYGHPWYFRPLWPYRCSRTNLYVEFLSHEPSPTNKQALIDGWLAGCCACLLKMCMLPSWSFLILSRALLIRMLACVIWCSVSVASALTCEQVSSVWWLVSGLCCFTFPKNVHVAFGVILDGVRHKVRHANSEAMLHVRLAGVMFDVFNKLC